MVGLAGGVSVVFDSSVGVGEAVAAWLLGVVSLLCLLKSR